MPISKKYLKDYKTVDYQNPRVRKKNRERRLGQFRIGGTIAVVVVLGLIYFFVFSGFFTLQNVEIQGNQFIAKQEMQDLVSKFSAKKRLFILPQTNLLFFDIKALADQINKNYFLDKLVIEKYYPGTLQIQVAEKITAIAWSREQACYNLDFTGLVIGFCNEQASEKILKVRDLRGVEEYNVGDVIISSQDLKYFLDLNQGLEKTLELPVKCFEMSEMAGEIKVLLKQGTEIMLSQQMGAQEALAKIFVLFEQEIDKNALDQVSYIDMRFGDKIFYQ